MNTFEQTFMLVDALTQSEMKPVLSMNAKLMEEVGELSTALNIIEGHITHKTLSEPLVGEVADVVQCALSIFIKATPNATPQERLDRFLKYFESKTNKWATVQQGEYIRAQELSGAITVEDDNMSLEDYAMCNPKYRPSAAQEYTAKTGRHLTLAERMQENRLRDQRENEVTNWKEF